MILVDGELRIERYQDSQGNNKYSTYVLANKIEFLSSKKDGQAEPVMEDKAHDNMSIFEDFGEQVSIDGDFLD